MTDSSTAPMLPLQQGASVLVVGGTGFIGRHLATKCLELGAAVTVMTRAQRQTVRVAGARHVHCDLRRRESVAAALDGRAFQFVFNLGGYVDHTPYSAGGRDVIEQHLTGLMNLVDALDRPALRGFVQVGSSDEYGDQAAPQSGPFNSAPISPYAFAKRACTDLVRGLSNQEGFPGIATRLFLVYGPGQGTARLLPHVIQACLRDETFPVSPGEQTRDFCFVEDVVEGLILAGVTTSAHGSSVNIASGEPVQIRDIIESVVRLTQGGRPQFGARPYRQGESMALFADVSNTSTLLGWHRRTPLEEGLVRTIAAYRESTGVTTAQSADVAVERK